MHLTGIVKEAQEGLERFKTSVAEGAFCVSGRDIGHDGAMRDAIRATEGGWSDRDPGLLESTPCEAIGATPTLGLARGRIGESVDGSTLGLHAGPPAARRQRLPKVGASIPPNLCRVMP